MSGSPPFGLSLATETGGVDRFATLRIARQLRPFTHWCSIPEQERGSGFHPIPCIEGGQRREAAGLTSLESLVPYRNRAERIHRRSVQGENRGKKKESPATAPKVDWKALEVVHPDAAGIDMGGSEHWVAIRPDRDDQPVRCFECFTSDLEQMADWLAARGVRSVAMQSTGVYWMPVFEILQQRGMEVYLVNARHTKNLPGRKSDIAECQGLLKLHTFGLWNNSFQPSDAVRAVRTLWRHRGGLVAPASSAIQRLQKALIEMNIQLSNVRSDLSGVSGMAIMQAILAG
jgi:hypothetical protein